MQAAGSAPPTPGSMDSRRTAGGWDRALFASVALVFVVAGSGLALWLGPEPHSDWLHYWRSAGDPSFYERGGIGVWLLAIPKALGLGPVASSLCLNLPAGLAILWMARRADRTRWRGLALLSAAYLLALVTYVGIVQLDLLSTAFVAAGWSLALMPPRACSARLAGMAAMACFAAGVSIKPQYALLIWAMLGLLVVPGFLWRRRETVGGALLVTLLAGSVAGFALDYGLREFSGRSERLRTSSAVTLYGGLLVSRIEGCGYWSVEAAEAAQADKDKPLLDAVGDRLAAKPAGHWLSILRCKWPQILRPPPYALYWLVESPNIRERINASPQRERIEAWYGHAINVERRFYSILTAIILLCVPLAVAMSWRQGARLLAILPLAWVGSYWSVHLVFEIQGRYFLGLFLLAPMVVALVLDAARRNGAVESAVIPSPTPEPAP